MKQKLHLSNINFSNLFSYEKALSVLNPISSIGNLNASFIYNKETNVVSILILDTTALVKLTMQSEVTSNDFEEENIGIQIDFKKFFYAINQYKDNSSKIEIILEKENLNNYFMIKNGTDKISLPVIELTSDKINEFNDRFLDEVKEESYVFNTKENKDYLINLNISFRNSYAFIGRDEQKNNAGALYLDKFIVNDRRHIYIQKFPTIDTKYEEFNNSFITLHKKNMRIISETLNTEVDYELKILKNYSKIYITTLGFSCILNNALANIVPPNEEELEAIKPINKIFETTIDTLYKASSFFSGFYSSSNDIRALSMKLNDKKELMLYLKDTGVAGFGEFSIEKILSSSIDLDIIDKDQKSTIIFDSLKDFLNKEDSNETVEIYMDADKPAVFVKLTNSEIYLAKLQG
jgi:hypothetical protein